MKVSPLTFKILNILSAVIHAAFESLLYQLVLSGALMLLSENIDYEVRIFTSGIIIVSFLASSLYGFVSLLCPAAALKVMFARAGMLLVFLNDLFAVTTEYIVPLKSIILSLAAFSCICFVYRYWLRQILVRKIYGIIPSRTA